MHQMVRHDVNSDEEGAPDAAAVADLIAWLSPVIAQVRAGDPVRVLSHCHQGISRSTAAALIALMLYHRGKAKRAFEDLLAITNKPWPNAKILRLAEAECGWGNGLSAIVDEYRAGFRHRPASYGRLQRRTGLDL
ncbi:MAG: hypothetical protein V2J26_01605 [Pacificimonas sp.]|nr:hypothetical protein [Pacificimonas sp.]